MKREFLFNYLGIYKLEKYMYINYVLKKLNLKFYMMYYSSLYKIFFRVSC